MLYDWRMDAKIMKRIISVIICTLVLMSGFVINTSALEEAEAESSALAYVPSGYELMNFGELYADKKFEITQNESKATVSQKLKPLHCEPFRGVVVFVFTGLTFNDNDVK